jgi:hypothetical protein
VVGTEVELELRVREPRGFARTVRMRMTMEGVTVSYVGCRWVSMEARPGDGLVTCKYLPSTYCEFVRNNRVLVEQASDLSAVCRSRIVKPPSSHRCSAG